MQWTPALIEKYGLNPEYVGRVIDVTHRRDRNETTLVLADPSAATGTTTVTIPYHGWYVVDVTDENRAAVAERRAADAARTAKTHLRAVRGKHAGRSGRIQRSMRSYYDTGTVHMIAEGVWVHERDAVLMTAAEYEANRTERRCAGCGRVLGPGEGMHASLGLACDACFDRLSDV